MEKFVVLIMEKYGISGEAGDMEFPVKSYVVVTSSYEEAKEKAKKIKLQENQSVLILPVEEEL